MSEQTIVIIGSGIAGLSAAEAARKQDPDVRIHSSVGGCEPSLSQAASSRCRHGAGHNR